MVTAVWRSSRPRCTPHTGHSHRHIRPAHRLTPGRNSTPSSQQAVGASRSSGQPVSAVQYSRPAFASRRACCIATPLPASCRSASAPLPITSVLCGRATFVPLGRVSCTEVDGCPPAPTAAATARCSRAGSGAALGCHGRACERAARRGCCHPGLLLQRSASCNMFSPGLAVKGALADLLSLAPAGILCPTTHDPKARTAALPARQGALHRRPCYGRCRNKQSDQSQPLLSTIRLSRLCSNCELLKEVQNHKCWSCLGEQAWPQSQECDTPLAWL